MDPNNGKNEKRSIFNIYGVLLTPEISPVMHREFQQVTALSAPFFTK
jgi:hypothetical protein